MLWSCIRRSKKILALGMGFLFAFGAGPYCQAGSVTTIQPSFKVSTEYTDNVNLEKDNKESEYITLITPQISLTRLTKISDLNIRYAPSLSLYSKSHGDNTFRQSLSSAYSRQLAKHVSWSVSDNFSRTEELYTPSSTSDQNVPPELRDTTTRKQREPRSVNTFSTGIDYQYGPKDSWSMNYSLGHVWDESETGEDSTRHTLNTSLSRWFTPQWGTEVSAGYTHGSFSGDTESLNEWTGDVKLSHAFSRHLDAYIDYAHTAVRYQGTEPDYDVYDPGMGIDWTFAKDANANLRIGYYIRDEQGRDRETGLSLDTTISKNWKLSKRTSFRLSGGSGYDNTYFGSENLGFTLYSQAQGTLNYAIGKHTSSSFNVSYRRNKYTDQDPERRDNIYSFSTDISHQLTQRLSTSVSYSHRRIDSNISTEEYRENRITWALTFTPQGWRL